MPKVFIIILNYNGREFIRQCLNSVFKVNYSHFEVVVVDNNSTDGSLELARSLFPKAHFIRNEENVGFSAGNNVGIKFALEHGAEWVMLLNQDTIAERNVLEKLIEAGENDPDLGIISPLVFEGNTSRVWFSGGRIDWWRMKNINEREPIKIINYNSDFISGCSMLVKKEVFAKAGLLDEDFFLYYEDADLSVRAKKAGFRLAVIPGSRIRHFEKESPLAGNKLYWLVISGLIFFQKNASRLRKCWLAFYFFWRRMKNKKDVKEGKKEALAVQKAYRDFDKLCRKTK